MVNRYAGEATLKFGDEVFILKLSLGAIAEIEDQLGLKSLNDFPLLFHENGLTSKSLIVVLTAALVAGGLDRQEAHRFSLALEPRQLGVVLEALTAAFASAFDLEEQINQKEGNHNRPPVQPVKP